MKTLCDCGHAKSQHHNAGHCDYAGYSCECSGYSVATKRASTAKFNTAEDVLRYCEGRAGTKLQGHSFVPCGGGLYALEQTAPEDGAFPKMFYQRQRIELEALMMTLYESGVR